MNDQNQNVQPDYGFILNQQTQPPKKKADKKVIAILILLPLMLLTLGAALIFDSTADNVRVTETTADTSAQARELAGTYLSNLAKNEYGNAYALLGDGIKADHSLEGFSQLVPVIFANIKTAECQAQTEITNKIVYDCPTKKGEAGKVQITFSVSGKDELKIDKYEMGAKI